MSETTDEFLKRMADRLFDTKTPAPSLADRRRLLAIAMRGAKIPDEPTEAMLRGARDWAVKKYGKGISNDGATGCWKAMLTAALKEHF